MILIDTCVFIDYFRGIEEAISFLEQQKDEISLSVITKMELFQGAKDKKELKKIENFLGNFVIHHLNYAISVKALEFIKTYAKSHNLSIPDAIIASTAFQYRIPVFIRNAKDFKYLKGITTEEPY